jgi:hypothetical protein
MTEPTHQSLRAAFFRTTQGRIIGPLIIISLILGITIEGVQLITAIYNMRSAEGEMRAKTARDEAPWGTHHNQQYLDAVFGTPNKNTKPTDIDLSPPPFRTSAQINEFCASHLAQTLNRLSGGGLETKEQCIIRITALEADGYCTLLKKRQIDQDRSLAQCIASYQPE